jgi:hypothetical protein
MKPAWILAALLICLCGCTGSNRMVTARSVPQPVSCTGSVYDADGKIRTATHQDVVRHVELTKKRWSTLWGLVPFSRYEWDLSLELEKQLQETSGDAIVNLTVQADEGDSGLTAISFVTGIIPSYSEVKVVRFKDLGGKDGRE